MEETRWADQFRDLIGAADRASVAVQDIKAWAWENVVASGAISRETREPATREFYVEDPDGNTLRFTRT